MFPQPTGPGKTAPKLIHDFLQFDPLRNGKGNILTDPATPVGEGPQPSVAIGSCQHEYKSKSSQSVPPPLDARPDGSTKYKLALVCKKCRIHADVRIDYSRATNPCPNSACPLHHFQHLDNDEVTPSRILYAWQCSAPECQALLQISYRTARISDREKDMLTNTELLRRRFEAVKADDPTREGLRQAKPMEALSRLRKYTSDGLRPDRQRHSFPANNKRFMEAFGVQGEDCADLLQRLGFKYADEQWDLPNPPLITDRLEADASSQRELLEDVEIELAAWMFKISETDSVNPAAAEGWPTAELELRRTLAAQDYQHHVRASRQVSTNSEDVKFFYSLGALPDFADSLVDFAYERQSLCDPERLHYYFECLQVISEHRGTEALHTKVAVLQSQDLVSRRDFIAACHALQVATGEHEDRIIAKFQSQLQDQSATVSEELRQALYKIALWRDSPMLKNAARLSLETYDDALNWLGEGASKDTTDEGIAIICELKLSENKGQEETLRQAISIIARVRESDALHAWLATGSTQTYSMSVDEALRIITSVETHFESIEKSLFPDLFAQARSERPGEQTEKAIATIEKRLNGHQATNEHEPSVWPVGLQSHGNTCYLNSLLQYYFSIKPLRQIVIGYDDYKLAIDGQTGKVEKVGQRPVTMVEIEGGQLFAKELQHTFERMEKESGSIYQPTKDLVCRAFLPLDDHALMTSNGTAAPTVTNSTDEHKTNGHTENLASQDGHTPPAGEDSISSSMTLQGEETDVKMVDGTPPLTPPASPGSKPQIETEVQSEDVQAPALPPRPSNEDDPLKKAEAHATGQQDVAEVHDSIMFRLRVGMQPAGKDEFGEQTDPIRDLYNIRLSETAIGKDGLPSKPKESYNSSVTLNVPEFDTNIYAALDDYFDLHSREGDSATTQNTFMSLVDVPQLLQINSPRVNFDRTKGSWKSEVMMKLEDEIYLDRYLSNPEVMPKRQQCWGWRRQLRALRQEEKDISAGVEQLNGPAALSAASGYLNIVKDINDELHELEIEGLKGLHDDASEEDLSSALAKEAERLQARQAELKPEIEDLEKRLSAEFDDEQFRQTKYRLAAVFMHRGSSGSGHYWTFIHDFANNVWRKYNDETVSEVSAAELKDDIFEARGKVINDYLQVAPTPSYVVYVRDKDKEQVVQPLCRHPEPSPDPWAGNDVEMSNTGDWTQQPRTVDPKLTYEGGETGWDTERQVADDVKCRKRRDSTLAPSPSGLDLSPTTPPDGECFFGAPLERFPGSGKRLASQDAGQARPVLRRKASAYFGDRDVGDLVEVLTLGDDAAGIGFDCDVEED